MRLRQMLVLGTSLGLFATMPVIVGNAQDNSLRSVYRAYTQAQKSGDQQKIDAAAAALQAACGDAGATSLEDCLALIRGNGNGRGQGRARNAPQGEPRKGAEKPPAAEQPAEQHPPAEQAAPAPQPKQQQAAPAPSEQPPAEQPPAPRPEPKQAPAKAAPASKAAPANQKAAPAEQPARPRGQQRQQVAPETVAQLKAAVGSFNAAVAAYGDALDQGGDAAAARDKVRTAHERVAEICTGMGARSVRACLDAQGLSLDPLPRAEARKPAPKPGEKPAQARPEKPAPQPRQAEKPVPAPQPQQAEKPAPAPEPQQAEKPAPRPGQAERPAANPPANAAAGGEQQPVEPKSQPSRAQPAAPADQPAVPKEAITRLPEGVKEQEVAPLFDSAKDAARPAVTEAGQEAKQPATPRRERRQQARRAPAEPPPPPPTSDASAQADIGPVKVAPVEEEKGTRIETLPQLVIPDNVTVLSRGADTEAADRRAGDRRRDRNGGGDRQRDEASQPEANPFNFQIILDIGGQKEIRDRRGEHRRLTRDRQDQVYYSDLGDGLVRETIERPNGSRIVTVRNRYGDIVRRSRITRDGREYVLAYVDPRFRDEVDSYRDPGADLPPLRLSIPASDYVLDADQADVQQIETFFDQPPVEQVRRIYSIDEVKHSARIRDSVRRLEVGDLTFDTGAATISRSQVGALENIADAMLGLLDENPAETFLIEGHTDAVGSDVSNLELSDERAATVANVLTDFYQVPPENLVTQGYGERFLKIDTDGPERLNRRVTIRRITPLVAPVANR